MFARGGGRRRRRKQDEENEEDEKEEESATSVGTAFGKIWECYCALFFTFVLLSSLSPLLLFSGKCKIDEKLSLSLSLSLYLNSAEIPTDEILPIRRDGHVREILGGFLPLGRSAQRETHPRKKKQK